MTKLAARDFEDLLQVLPCQVENPHLFIAF
jgi:hypothetical protein